MFRLGLQLSGTELSWYWSLTLAPPKKKKNPADGQINACIWIPGGWRSDSIQNKQKVEATQVCVGDLEEWRNKSVAYTGLLSATKEMSPSSQPQYGSLY